MDLTPPRWESPLHHINATQPDRPVLYFDPDTLHATARRLIEGFPGLVSYAVKANDRPEVLQALLSAGITAFDVASVPEMRAIRRLSRDAALHYNNPVRSRAELAEAAALGVASYSVDSLSELAKLVAAVPARGTEVAVRFKLPVRGGIYDFGSKFGAEPDHAAVLLRAVADAGFAPAMTFHPGTQCEGADAWRSYITTAARIAREARVRLGRLNVGGGFAADRGGARPDLGAIFAAIDAQARRDFAQMPGLLCEPGRAMVAESYALALRVKAIRDGAAVFLNDGIYGHLAEAPLLGAVQRVTVLGPEGPRRGPRRPVQVFGPTCDSVDELPRGLSLPDDLAEDDHLLIHGMGAYCEVTATRFNGYGAASVVNVRSLGAGTGHGTHDR
ncbi:alanine racemase [Brevirhabdus sp.]|uniref:alanine racemase n=1 Tax=Brevirhabdus sp. TaxID=2004514 RepID=UPI0040584589